MEIFGEWLRQQRSLRRLTREEFAQRVGCSISALRKIEDGDRRPSAQIAELLANCLEISPEKRSTFVRVARGELSVDRLRPATTPSPTPTSSAIRSNLPVFATPLIGREPEVQQLCQLLCDAQCRLLTLVGPGGIGKTRLAIQAAFHIQSDFPDGAFFVPLASVNSSRLITPMIADAVGFSFQGQSSIDPKSQLFNYLTEKQIILLIDNLEHLLSDPAVTDLFTELLECAPQVKLFMTSRESLNLQEEWVFEVHGLPIPDGIEAEGTSVELFLQRARRAYVGFEATASVFPAIVRVCELLDGMPLGIEIAAGWVRTLSCEEIGREIEGGLDFLHASARDLPMRHRSMRAVFDHSWKLLNEVEQSSLSRLSVFRGGFTREAAELVANATVSTLASLVTKSLIRRSGAGRYDLHELIRQYALERLAERPEALREARTSHAHFYMTFLGAEDECLRGPEQQTSLNELTVEMDNILTAWHWALSQGKYELIGRAGRGIGRFFEVAGLFHEGIEQLDPLVQALQAETRDDELARLLGMALLQQGLLYFRKGQFVRAEGCYRDSITTLRPTGDKVLLADALTFLGVITYLNGEYAQARALLREGWECARASNARWFEAYAIYSLGYIDSLMGDYQKGYEQMRAGLGTWRGIGDTNYIALGLNFLTSTIIKLEHYDEAKAFVLESITLCEKAKNRWGLGTAYRYLGLISLAEGQAAEAQTHFHESLDFFGEYTEGWDIALSLYYSAEAAMMEGDLAEARKSYLEALRISFGANSIPIAIDCLLGLARLYLQDGESTQVLELAYSILNHPSSSKETKDHAEQLYTGMTERLAKQDVKVAHETLASKSFEDIVKAVLASNCVDP